MSRRFWIVLTIAVVLLAGAIYGFAAIDRANFGIPRFYALRAISGQYHGGHRAAINGVSIYYETYGSGPPVFVLHGAGAFLETMHYFISALEDGHTVIAVDSRAQGRSTDAEGPLTYALMGDDMIKLMDALGIKQADVVGWSDGGIVGLDMAMKHPGRVRRLVAIGSNYDANGVDPKQVGPALFEQAAREVKPFYDAVAPDPSHFPVLMKKIETMIQTEPHYTAADLRRIRARVLIVAGEHDAILRAHTDALAAAIPGAQKIIVPDASHFGPLEMPDRYNEIVLTFLDGP